jgi:hypothetical protein
MVLGMETNTILAEIASEVTSGGRACSVNTLLATIGPEEREALETTLADPVKYPATVVANYFRRHYPHIPIHPKSVMAHSRRQCRCFR